MIQDVIIKNLEKFEDKRGWLTEFWRDDELKDYDPVMGYFSITKPNVVRGPHEHVYQSDCFIFVGPGTFHLHLWDARNAKHRHGLSKTAGDHDMYSIGERKPTLVIVPPGVVHAYKCVSKTNGYVINLPNKLYKGKDKKEEIDEIRWEDNPDSPYKIV